MLPCLESLPSGSSTNPLAADCEELKAVRQSSVVQNGFSYHIFIYSGDKVFAPLIKTKVYFEGAFTKNSSLQIKTCQSVEEM